MNVRLNKKHQKTLEAIFSTQTPATLPWRRIEALFKALGATKEEGKTAIFHRLHNRKEAKRYQIRRARNFLTKVEITP